MRTVIEFLKSLFKSKKEEDKWMKEEIVSYSEYKKLLKNKPDRIKSFKVFPPKIGSKKEPTVKVIYKKPKRKYETKRVVHDPRFIKMDNPSSL